MRRFKIRRKYWFVLVSLVLAFVMTTGVWFTAAQGHAEETPAEETQAEEAQESAEILPVVPSEPVKDPAEATVEPAGPVPSQTRAEEEALPEEPPETDSATEEENRDAGQPQEEEKPAAESLTPEPIGETEETETNLSEGAEPEEAAVPEEDVELDEEALPETDEPSAASLPEEASEAADPDPSEGTEPEEAAVPEEDVESDEEASPETDEPSTASLSEAAPEAADPDPSEGTEPEETQEPEEDVEPDEEASPETDELSAASLPEDGGFPASEFFAAAFAGDCITSLTVSPSEVENYGKVRVEVTFSDGSPDEHVFHGGDSLDIIWPTEGNAILKGYTARIPLVNEEGITYGEVNVTPGGATITFNDNVNDMYDVNGSFFFDVMAINNSDTTEEDTQVATIAAGTKQADIAIHKSASGTVEGGDLPDFRKQADDIGGGYTYVEGVGWVMSLDPDDPTYTQWILTANENQQPIASDILIRDTLGEGQRLDRSYLLVYSTGRITSSLSGTVDSVTAAWNSAHPGSHLSFNAGGLSWKIDQATADGTYWCMVYRCEITDFSRVYFENSADIQWVSPDGTDYSAHDAAMFSNVEQGGDVHVLPRGVLQVEKTVSGTEVKVAGVTFAVQRRDGGEWVTVGTMTTDASGSATLSKLRTGHYRLFETETPAHLIPRYTEETPYEFDLDLDSPSTQSLALNVENAVRTFSVAAEKRWLNADGTADTGEHPTVWLQLYRRAPNQTRAVAVGGPVQLSDGQNQASWSDLPIYDVHGREYVYSIRETDEQGRDWVPEGYAKAEEGLVVTNTKDAAVDIPVIKTWDDGSNQDGLRPQSITVQLLANGEPVDSATIVPDEQGEWKYTFTGLPKYRDGAEIAYSVAEEPVSGYRSSVDGFGIVNTHTPETVDIPVIKTWDDGNNQDGLRPQSITVKLLANGEPVDSATIVPDEQGEWKHTFAGLPKYRDGIEIVYTLSEAAVGNYSCVVENSTLTNRYTPGRTTVHVAKIWEDQDNQDGLRPESIQVQLLADEKPSGPAVTLSDETGWSYTWTDLPEKSNGQTIAYSVDEVEVEGYTCELSGSADAGYVLTNRHVPATIDIPVTKSWDDAENAYGKRPGEVTVYLLADGERVRTLTLKPDQEGRWAGRFSDLPRFAGGREIAYTVAEAPVEGYVSIVDGFGITNRIRVRHRVIHGQASVSKTDTHGNALEGARFTLYAGNDGTREIKDYTGSSFSIGTDDEALASCLPLPGESVAFCLRETEAPEGYMLSGREMEVVITAVQSLEIGEDGAFEERIAYGIRIDGEDSVTVENERIPSPATLSLGAVKRLEGMELSEKMFSFELLDAHGDVLQTVQNGKDGSVAFAPIEYDREGVYTYTLREIAASMAGMTYDPTEYTVIVTVTDRDGELTAAADKAPETIVFRNQYSPANPDTPEHRGHTAGIPKTGYGPDRDAWMALADIFALLLLSLLVKREKDA